MTSLSVIPYLCTNS